MRKAYLLSAIVLLASAWLLAQTATNSNSQSDHNMNKTTVQGCLGGSASNYTLTDQAGKNFDLRGDTAKLGEHLGQEVRITGSEQKASASSTSTSSTSNSMMPTPTIQVSNIEKVSDTCSTTKK